MGLAPIIWVQWKVILATLASSPPGGGQVSSYGTSVGAVGVVNVTGYNGSSIQGDFSFDAFANSPPNDTIQISGTFDLSIVE